MMKSMASSLSLLLALSCLAQLAANAAAAPLVIGIFVRFQTDAIANQLNLWKDQVGNQLAQLCQISVSSERSA
jgi:hypothetical protein